MTRRCLLGAMFCLCSRDCVWTRPADLNYTHKHTYDNAAGLPCSWHGAGWLVIRVFVTQHLPMTAWCDWVPHNHPTNMNLSFNYTLREGLGRDGVSWLPCQDARWLREERSWRRPRRPDKFQPRIWNYLALISFVFPETFLFSFL